MNKFIAIYYLVSNLINNLPNDQKMPIFGYDNKKEIVLFLVTFFVTLKAIIKWFTKGQKQILTLQIFLLSEIYS